MSNFKPEKPILQKTDDGSHTLYLKNLDETYHSSAGALAESIHVYINNGYKLIDEQESIKILEVGFGTGANAILTFFETEKDGKKVEYHGIEPFPVPLEIIENLEMGFISEDEKLKSILMKLHQQNANKRLNLSDNFQFTRWKKTIQEFEGELESFDIIYYDAFAPRKQAEMWKFDILKKTVEMLKENGIFITYCANGQFKRDLKSLSMKLNTPAGIGRRREITQAIKIKL